MALDTPSREFLRPDRFRHDRVGLPCGGAIAINSTTGPECAIGEAHLDEAEAAEVRSALDAHAIVAITDPLGRITFVNDRFCAISQYSREELLGVDLRILNSGHHPETYFRGLWETITRGETWHGEIKNRAKDGSFYWIAATIVPFFDAQGTLRKFIAINSDITEQKRIEAELAERLRLQRLLADLPSRFIAVQSDKIDAAIEDTLRLIVQILRLDLGRLWQIAENGSDMALSHSWCYGSSPGARYRCPDEANLPWIFAQVMRGENVCFSSISELPPAASRDVEELRSDGVMSNLTIPLIVNGRVSGALAFSARYKERVWREDEVIELKLVAQIIGSVIGRQRAERREEQLRAELAHATRVATLGELAATLAHELNQPLAAILSNAQAARRFIAANAISQEELTAIFDDIVRDDKRAGGIIHNLRAMVSKGPAVREPCCLNELVRDVVDLMHAEVLGANLVLHSALVPSLPQVKASRVELQQVLMNLLVNAMHAMKGALTARRVIEVETIAAETSVLVRIRDYGHGIPPERLPHIFDPFFTTKSSGLGMGLSICRRIIESHGGRIEACNREGGCACFTLWLPVAESTV